MRVLRVLDRNRIISTALALTMIAAEGCTTRHRAAPTSRDAADTLSLGFQTDHPDSISFEPMVIQDVHGTLFTSGINNSTSVRHPSLRKSGDGGRTWSRVEVGDTAQGAFGNSDVDLAAAPDGTLYFIALTFDSAAYEGRRIAVGVSKDAGASWSWTTLAENRFDDRPWIAVAPNGVAHVIWNDDTGVYHASSSDRGANWTQGVRIHDHGGSSHLAVGPRGEVAVRITPYSASGHKLEAGVDLIAVSSDEGTTWAKHAAPGTRDWARWAEAVTKRWVEPLAWDEKGSLYYLWTDSTGVWLSRSLDNGAAWSEWRVVASGGRCHFPYLVARGSGELAATWFCGLGNELRAHAARLQMTDGDGPPRVIQSLPFAVDAWWRRTPADSLVHDEMGEYLAITFLRAGGFGVVSPIYNPITHYRGFTWRVFQGR